MITCSACQSEMKSVSLHGEEIEKCTNENCEAIFLDISELKIHRNNDIDGFESEEIFGKREDEHDIRKCPKCTNTNLIAQEFVYNSNIHIDKCPECKGIFLDKGELLAIDNFIEREKKSDLPANILEQVNLVKSHTHAEFLQTQEERKQLYKYIDSIPGINFLVRVFG